MAFAAVEPRGDGSLLGRVVAHGGQDARFKTPDARRCNQVIAAWDGRLESLCGVAEVDRHLFYMIGSIGEGRSVLLGGDREIPGVGF